MTDHFDIDRIISIEVIDKSLTSHRWLPRKQKTFLGFKINKWHDEGFYYHGCYQECYESGCFDSTPSSRESLEKYGYLVDDQDQVWNRPYVTVYLESKCQVRRSFDSLEEAEQWVEELKQTSGKTFEIVKHK